MEMQVININGNDGTASEKVSTVNNGDGAAYEIPEETERDGLLQPAGCNGGAMPAVQAAEFQNNFKNMSTPQENNCICRIMNELKKPAWRRIKLCVCVVTFIMVIIAVVLISMVVCSALHEDKDENFDRSLFKVPRSFNGSFQLPNMVFTEDLYTLSSNESQTLAVGLQEKLAALYQSSPALGRYFNKAEITAFRNGSVIADYQLTFIMPEEQQDQLRNFTLSREMVYNVLRQFLYDQETAENDSMYVDPDSLNMLLRH